MAPPSGAQVDPERMPTAVGSFERYALGTVSAEPPVSDELWARVEDVRQPRSPPLAVIPLQDGSDQAGTSS